jgi:hypothetical protein
MIFIFLIFKLISLVDLYFFNKLSSLLGLLIYVTQAIIQIQYEFVYHDFFFFLVAFLQFPFQLGLFIINI